MKTPKPPILTLRSKDFQHLNASESYEETRRELAENFSQLSLIDGQVGNLADDLHTGIELTFSDSPEQRAEQGLVNDVPRTLSIEIPNRAPLAHGTTPEQLGVALQDSGLLDRWGRSLLLRLPFATQRFRYLASVALRAPLSDGFNPEMMNPNQDYPQTSGVRYHDHDEQLTIEYFAHFREVLDVQSAETVIGYPGERAAIAKPIARSTAFVTYRKSSEDTYALKDCGVRVEAYQPELILVLQYAQLISQHTAINALQGMAAARLISSQVARRHIQIVKAIPKLKHHGARLHQIFRASSWANRNYPRATAWRMISILMVYGGILTPSLYWAGMTTTPPSEPLMIGLMAGFGLATLISLAVAKAYAAPHPIDAAFDKTSRIQRLFSLFRTASLPVLLSTSSQAPRRASGFSDQSHISSEAASQANSVGKPISAHLSDDAPPVPTPV